jgi:hypothetical protein
MTRSHGYFEKSEKELVDHIAESMNAILGDQSAPIAEMQRRLIIAIQSSGDCASAQTAEVIKLTNALKVLTYALIAIGAIQIGLMLLKKGGP